MKTESFRLNKESLQAIKREVYTRKAAGESVTIRDWIEEAIQEKLKKERER